MDTNQVINKLSNTFDYIEELLKKSEKSSETDYDKKLLSLINGSYARKYTIITEDSDGQVEYSIKRVDTDNLQPMKYTRKL